MGSWKRWGLNRSWRMNWQRWPGGGAEGHRVPLQMCLGLQTSPIIPWGLSFIIFYMKHDRLTCSHIPPEFKCPRMEQSRKSCFWKPWKVMFLKAIQWHESNLDVLYVPYFVKQPKNFDMYTEYISYTVRVHIPECRDYGWFKVSSFFCTYTFYLISVLVLYPINIHKDYLKNFRD